MRKLKLRVNLSGYSRKFLRLGYERWLGVILRIQHGVSEYFLALFSENELELNNELEL